MKPKQLGLLLSGFAITVAAFANNIQITNVSLTGQNTTNHTTQVQFTLSWENSWRLIGGPGNWDAAWVFVKYRQANGDWNHARLNTDPNHVAPAGSTINTGLLNAGAAFDEITNPGIGAFIYRSTSGTGTFTVTNAQLQWKYGADGVADNVVVDVQVFAIEMVYLPQGDFAVGDGLHDANQFTITTINTSNSIMSAAGTGSLGGQAGGYPTGSFSPNNGSWPNGFNAFYCMKYEISQQGYTDFLNTLTRAQQSSRVSTSISSGTTSITNRYVMSSTSGMASRNSIRCDAIIPSNAPVNFYCDYDGNGIGGEATDGKDIPCNYLNWNDVAAYLHWTGLRPMTELEFEKCGRGNLLPVPGEFAWGDNIIVQATSIIDPGLSSEKPNTGANAVYGNGILGQLRVGSIADATTNRQQAGAGYYGVMELSGNLFERTVTTNDPGGRTFLGGHGSGILNSGGNTTNVDWIGANFRGGCWQFLPNDERLSARQYLFTDAITRYEFVGGRGCRSAP
jgi:formylglycine-generating enzyme required for sulfatase activity